MKAASTSTDAEIWREILRKAEKGTTNEPYFVVEIQHPNSFCKIVSCTHSQSINLRIWGGD